jgi:hypothetical protein
MAFTPMCLRVEDPNGRTVAEYRIRDEAVEVRRLPLMEDGCEWHRLTAEELVKAYQPQDCRGSMAHASAGLETLASSVC